MLRVDERAVALLRREAFQIVRAPRHRPRLQDGTDARDIIPPQLDRQRHPGDDQRNDQIAQDARLKPQEIQTDDPDDGGDPLPEPEDHHVDEGLDLIADRPVDGQIQHLFGGLLEGVIHRAVVQLGGGRHPEYRRQQHPQRSADQPDGQHQQRARQPKMAQDPAREEKLHDERGGIHPAEKQPGEGGLRILVRKHLLDEGVELVVDEGRDDLRDPDQADEEDEVAGPQERPQSAAGLRGLRLGTGRGGVFRDQGRRGMAAPQLADHQPAADQDRRGPEEKLFRPEQVGADGGDRGAHHPAEDAAGADESEEPLGLPRMIEIVGDQPEQRHHEHREDRHPDIESGRHPFVRPLEELPEHDEVRRHHPEGPADQPLLVHPVDEAGEQRHHGPHQHGADEVHVGNQPRAQLAKDEGTADRLDDVVGGDDEEKIEEGQEHLRAFSSPDLR